MYTLDMTTLSWLMPWALSTWPMLLGQVELRLAERGNDAGMLGAASLFFPSDISTKVEN